MFLSEQLWTGGLIAVLAAFLLWQSYVREQALRTETQAREARMACRIDFLEQRHAEALSSVVKSVTTIEAMEKELTSLREAMANNCNKCDARRDELKSLVMRAFPGN